MQKEQSLEQHTETQFALGRYLRAVPSSRTPRQNRLLAALPQTEYERLLPALQPVVLPRGSIVGRAGEPDKHLYFLAAGIVSRHCVMENGASAEYAVTGSEGVVNIAAFLGGEGMAGQAVAVCNSHAYRLHGDCLKTEFRRNAPLAHLLLRYFMALMVQIGQAAACNQHHALEQRLCRMILSYLDRLPSSQLAMTHERIADALGVRRESVTEIAGKLQRAGLIQCARGRIAVIDRPRLELTACECYGVIKQAYDRLIPAFEHAVSRLADAA